MRNFSKVILGMFMLVLFNSCKHNNFSEYVGPSICPSSSFRFLNDFKLSSPSSIDFTSQPGDTITADFSEAVSWTVTIKGLSSGAIKTYQEHSTSINIVWQGEPGANKVFFTTGETVAISLAIPCVDTKLFNVKLTKASDFTSFGEVVNDFDGLGYANPNPIFYGLDQPTVVNGPLTSPQGSSYLYVKGGETTSWFAGGVEYAGPTMLKVSNPDSVYFNAYVSSGNNTTTVLGLTLTNGGTKAINKFNLAFPVNWKGWRFVSYPLSAFKNSAGASMTDAKATTFIDFGLNCATQMGQSTEVNLDFVMFTYNKPFFQ